MALADLIMAVSDIDGMPAWLRPAGPGLRRAFLRGFRAAVRDDPAPYLAEVARYRLADANIRPDEAERVRRLAGLPGPGDLSPPRRARTR